MNEIPQWAIQTKADQRAIETGYYWDQSEADRIISFAEKYIKTQFIKGKFKLLEWQKQWLMRLYGWRHPSGRRRWRKAILHIAKKNGKTLLVSILCVYECFCSGSQSPRIASASTSRDNATQVYSEVAYIINKNPSMKKISQTLDGMKKVKVKKHNAEYKALSSDAASSEGENLSFVVVDECHAHKNKELYKALEYSTVAREDGLLVTISTAGDNRTHWYFDLTEKAKNIIKGDDLDVTTMADVYEVDPDKDDLMAVETWRKANPSLGTSFTEEAFRLDLLAAKANTADWLNFQRYRLNIWCSSADQIWIDLADFDKCKRVMPDSDLVKYPCTFGIDLSQVEDPSSISACFALPGKRYHIKSWAFVAREGCTKREKQNLPKYEQFVAEKSMIITDGDVLDEWKIRAFILEKAALYSPKKLVYDPTGAFIQMNEMQSHGYEVERMPQTHRYYSDPMKEFERAVKEQRLTHDGSSWLRWCINSVRLDLDTHGNIRPSSRFSVDHIDGAVSALMAFSQCYQYGQEVVTQKSVYEDRGLLFF